MARKSASGRFTISAGEVGAYCVCPEAWRLRSLERVETSKPESASEGMKLHQEWAKQYEETIFLSRGVRILILLLILSALIFGLLR